MSAIEAPPSAVDLHRAQDAALVPSTKESSLPHLGPPRSCAPVLAQRVIVSRVSHRAVLPGIGISLTCRVFPTPFDILLPETPAQTDDDVPNVVQPDIIGP
jgi:hypothetical protein